MLKVGFQGEKGAYSEIASIRYFTSCIETIGYRTFSQVFGAVNKKEIDYGILPIENSTSGSINENYDLLLKNNLFIVGETLVKIRHCLIAKKDTAMKNVKKVYSHPQALYQCKEFLEKYNLEQISTFDTAGSAKIIKNSKRNDGAIIASESVARIHGLKILKRNISTNKNNTTRFIIISKNEYKPNLNEREIKTSVVFRTKHRPGALVDCLIEFRDNKVNLTKIQSRPILNKPWEYSFYLDFEGSKNDTNVKSALQRMNKYASFVKILGSYPKDGTNGSKCPPDRNHYIQIKD